MFDMRFLTNPYYDPMLQSLTGKDVSVGEAIEQDALFAPFFSHMQRMIASILPRLKEKERLPLAVAIGCTGGQHRSVYTAEKLAAFLSESGYSVVLTHRDL